MENDYKRDIVRFRMEINPQRRAEIDEQRKKFSQFYETYLTLHDQYENYFADKFDQQGVPLMTNFRPNQYLELKEELKQLNEKRVKFDRLIEQVSELIKRFEDESSAVDRSLFVYSTKTF